MGLSGLEFFFLRGKGGGELVAVVVREACNVCGREGVG